MDSSIAKKIIPLIQNNNINELKDIVSNNLDKINFNDKSLFYYPIKYNNYESLKWLCGNTSNIILFLYNNNCLDKKLLNFIIKHNDKEITGESIYQFVRDGRDDLIKLIFRNYIFNNNFIMKLILYYKHKIALTKAELNELIVNEKNKFKNEINYISKDDSSNSPLLIGCKNNNEFLVKYLIDLGANVNVKNDNGETPLLLACKEGNIDIVKNLVSHGADINIYDKYGETPLFETCFHPNESLVTYLIEQGAEVNVKDNIGDTPLIIASEYGNVNIVKILIDNGADINVVDEGGETPLTVAYRKENKDIVKYLIAHGAFTW